MKRLLLILAAVLLMASGASAANTETVYGNTIMISAIDSDWTATQVYYIDSIVFVPGSTNDILVIENGSTSGPRMFYAKSTDGEPKVMYYFGRPFWPVLDFSDCTLNAGMQVIINLSKPD